MKIIVQNDFNKDCVLYDCNVEDVFGHKFYVLYNEMLNQIRFVSKYSDYIKRRRLLDSKNLQHVIIQKYGEVIDISEKTYNKIQKYFPSTNFPYKEKLNIY